MGYRTAEGIERHERAIEMLEKFSRRASTIARLAAESQHTLIGGELLQIKAMTDDYGRSNFQQWRQESEGFICRLEDAAIPSQKLLQELAAAAARWSRESERLVPIVTLEKKLYELEQDYRSDRYEEAHFGYVITEEDHERYRRERQELEAGLQRLWEATA